MKIEIDNESGFCFGVTTAIRKAEAELTKEKTLYCLGDIVHNGQECERLRLMGLHTINHTQFSQLKGAKVLFRAHGEPPATYCQAKENSLDIIDATCPVVLKLQERIRQGYHENTKAQIVIFGKNGHAEVLGLVGQTDGQAIVIENLSDAARLDFSRDIQLYSQTTQSLEDFWQIVDFIKAHIAPHATFKYHDTICRQVANRMNHIRMFAARHDLIFFVTGKKSSNGKVLLEECLKVNPNTHSIEKPEDIQLELLQGIESAGICGATSTPKWLMEECKKRICNQIAK